MPIFIDFFYNKWYFISRGDFVISYIGLEEVLREQGKDRRYLHEVVGLSNDTIAKFKKGESVSVSVLERICLALDCQIEDIVKIKKDRT